MSPRGRPDGGDKFAQAKKSFEKTIKVNKSAAKIEIKPDEEGRIYQCTCCGKEYTRQRNNFPMSASPLFKGNNGYASICKHCLDKYYLQVVEFFSGNEEKAIERCCQVLDWYFSTNIVAMVKKNVSVGQTRISYYPSKMNINHVKGTTYLDTIAERASQSIDSIEEVQELVEEDSSIDVEELKRSIKFFGSGYKPEEYKFLQDEYDDWISRYEAKTKAQEELFKNLCIVQLSIQQAKQRDDNKAVTDGMKTFQDLLGSASLKPNQNNDNALVEQNTFGTLIKKWEDEKPIPEPSEEFQDVDNIIRYVSAFFNGHLAKMMNIDNDYSRLYDEEVGKYTVNPPEYIEDEASEDEQVDEDGNSRDT